MSLYVPGYGRVSDEELAIRAACRNHDTDLVFQRSERTGNFTIYQRLQRDNAYVKEWENADLEQGDLFPVIAFPHRRMPSVDEVNKWLYEHDQYRGDLLEKVQRHNAGLRKAMDDKDADERAWRAEFLEHGFRMLGEDTGHGVSTRNFGTRRRTYG